MATRHVIKPVLHDVIKQVFDVIKPELHVTKPVLHAVIKLVLDVIKLVQHVIKLLVFTTSLDHCYTNMN